MQANTMATIAVRVLALYLFVQGLLTLPNLSIFVSIDPARLPAGAIYQYTAAIMTPFVVGIVVLILAKPLANWVMPAGMPESEKRTAGIGDIQSIAFAVLGLFIVFIAIPNVIGIAVANYQQNAMLNKSVSVFSNPKFIAHSIALLFGLSLFVGVRFWIGLYNRLRNFGLKNKPPID